MRSWVFLLALAAPAQTFTQRGFLESRNFFYPQTVEGDSGRAVSEALLRWETAWKPRSWVQFQAVVDARADSRGQTARTWQLDWADRGLRRPALGVRRLSVLVHRGEWTVEAGRQFIRWGKTDILNPTDRFAPKDFLNVLNSEFLGVTAARATWERGSETLDVIVQPVFTPSRGPLLGQRWVSLDPALRRMRLEELPVEWPERPAWGVRWGHVGAGYEASASYYDGQNHLPVMTGRARDLGTLELRREYARMRMVGGDVAAPLKWFTVKGEAGWFQAPGGMGADEYVLYVVQAERTSGEWVFVGGYAGEAVTKRGASMTFAPDRGLAKSVLGRASYNLDARRTVAGEVAVREDGGGMYAKGEYTQTVGAHWRWTGSWTLLRGRAGDFLGQYRRNSNVQVVVRYSF